MSANPEISELKKYILLFFFFFSPHLLCSARPYALQLVLYTGLYCL